MVSSDALFMERALELARKGAGLASPNPVVGAVVARDGNTVGEGYYLYAGIKHAESYALEMAGEQARGATIYCSLEPCSHFGRTPPCTSAIVEAGISRAVVATIDPDPRVNGSGLVRLRDAGIEVETGVCETQARHLNAAFLKYASSGVPFLHVILGVSSVRHDLKDWAPSKMLVESASLCDALVLGDDGLHNRVFVEAFLKRDRHRSAIIGGTPESLERAGLADRKANDPELTLVSISDKTDDSKGGGRAVLHVEPQVDPLLKAFSGLRVISLMFLPGALQSGLIKPRARADRVTMVVDNAAEPPETVHQTCKSLMVHFGEFGAVSSGNYTEFTGDLTDRNPD